MKLFEVDEILCSQISDDAQEKAHHHMLQSLKSPKLLIDNIQTELKAALYQDAFLPVTINDAAYNTSHVCSMYTTMVSYARQELRHIDRKILRKVLLGFVHCLDGLLKTAKIDRIVSNNNFFLATNLYPSNEFHEQNLSQYILTTAAKYKKHAILFKSLNSHTNAKLMQTLKNIGCKLMPSRQIYLFDAKLKDFNAQRPYQVDLKLLKNNKDYTLCGHDEITENDYERIVHLYNKLYIFKHSIYNPRFNAHYIQKSHEHRFIKYYCLRNNAGVIDGFIGFYDRHNVTTTPLVGYDTDLPQTAGLYRMLMAHAIDRASRKGMILNLSSGASEFKLRRGAVPFIEYQAVYTKHLNNQFQKLTWKLLNGILTHLGIPIMKKYL